MEDNINIKQELAISAMQKDIEYMCKDMHNMHKESTLGILEIKKLLDKNDEAHRAILDRLDNQLTSQNGRIKMYSEEFNKRIGSIEGIMNSDNVKDVIKYYDMIKGMGIKLIFVLGVIGVSIAIYLFKKP